MKYLLSGLVFAMLAAGPALAQDCPPLKTISSIALQPSASRLQELVPVTIDGVDKKLLLDTGGYTTQLTPQLAQELKLQTGGSGYTARGVGAHTQSMQSVSVSDFLMGNMRVKDVSFFISIIPGLAQQADGLLASDLLLGYDVDMDFGHDKLNFMSSDHCAGKIVYWQAQALAEVPLRIVNGHYLINVALNGRTLVAILDTGAEKTSIGLGVAQHHYGLTPSSPDMLAAEKANGVATTYMHKFDSLSFDGVEIHSPTLAVIESDALNSDRAARGASVVGRTQPYDMILGMDMMRHLHVYIATKERKIYITPA